MKDVSTDYTGGAAGAEWLARFSQRIAKELNIGNQDNQFASQEIGEAKTDHQVEGAEQDQERVTELAELAANGQPGDGFQSRAATGSRSDFDPTAAAAAEMSLRQAAAAVAQRQAQQLA